MTMIRKIFNSIFVSSALLMGLTSCDLTLYPNDAIPSDASWETAKDAERFRTGIYSKLREVSGGKYEYTSDQQSDLFNSTISYGNRGGEMQRWDFTASQYDIEDFWQYNYYTIVNSNNIIENIDKITPEDEDENKRLAIIKGEAFLMRAYCYHSLVLKFAKDYEPNTAASDLGLPIVLTFDTEARPSRSTLAETYAQIKSDITSSRALLTTEGSPNSVYFTADVIDLFEARVDLCMHNFSNAVTLAEKVIGKYPLVNNAEALSSMWLNDESSEILFRVFQSSDERMNSWALYLNYNVGNSAFAPDYVPSKWILDLYEPSDIRKNVYYLTSKITCTDQSVTDVAMLNKYPGNPALKRTNPYEYYQMPKLFRSAEAYLIAAEAAFQSSNEPGARSFLNGLREKRGASAITSSGNQLYEEIKKEWIREFIGEGKRIDCLKRWGDGLTRRDPQNEVILNVGAQYTSFSTGADNIRFVWEIPNNDLNANPNLVPNWK